MSDTVLKDCVDDISYLQVIVLENISRNIISFFQTLPQEDFTLQNYLKQKNRVPTPPPPTADEQPSVVVEEEETKVVVVDEQKETKVVVDKQEENIIPTNEDEQEKSDTNIDDSVLLPPVDNQIDNVTSFVRSRSPSPARIEDQPPTEINQHALRPTPDHFSANSSTTLLAPIEPPIRVEITEKSKSFIPTSQNVSQPRKEIPPPPPPPPPSSQPSRSRKQKTDFYNQPPIQVTVSDQSTGKRY